MSALGCISLCTCINLHFLVLLSSHTHSFTSSLRRAFSCPLRVAPFVCTTISISLCPPIIYSNPLTCSLESQVLQPAGPTAAKRAPQCAQRIEWEHGGEKQDRKWVINSSCQDGWREAGEVLGFDVQCSGSTEETHPWRYESVWEDKQRTVRHFTR